MNLAERIIERFGGITATAKRGGWPVSTVQGWKERGLIPQRRWPELMELAASENIPLTASDFLPTKDAAQ